MIDVLFKATSREAWEAWAVAYGWISPEGYWADGVAIDHVGPTPHARLHHHVNVRLTDAALAEQTRSRPQVTAEGDPVHSTEATEVGALFRSVGRFVRTRCDERWIGDVAFIYPESVQTRSQVWS